MIFFDSETCGLHGVPVIFQYAEDDGPVIIHNCWTEPAFKTIELLKMFSENEVVGFNLAFDWFHVNKFFNMLSRLPNLDWVPEFHIADLVEVEMEARDGLCLKPKKACDLMLHARKGPYQSTMDRHDIKIKRVPTPLAGFLAKELEQRIPLKDIYFARSKEKVLDKWQVYDCFDSEGNYDPNFKDICLKFKPSSAMKVLAVDALGRDVLMYDEISISKNYYPEEVGYAPFAKACNGNTWDKVLTAHIEHWTNHELAIKYAMDDVTITRDLYNFFGRPELGDDDSELACMVACVRWKGYKIDEEKIKDLKRKAIEIKKSAPRAPNQVKEYIWPDLSETERAVTEDSTSKIILEEIAEFTTLCNKCEGEGCQDCNDGEVIHPAAIKARQVIAARAADKEIDLYDKLLLAGRFHASFKVIGTLSSRMAGADGLNPQGIKRTTDVRVCFPLAFDGFVLSGGDFDAFEVVLADATYDDEKLREDLNSGKKIHALFARELFPEETYESILASKGTENDMYTAGKSGVFSQIYGGDANTLKHRLGINLETATAASMRFEARYPGIKAKRQRIQDMFCSMRQPGGIGKKVEWHEPADKIESLFGFARYFTLENSICKALFGLAENPPKAWTGLKIKVVRRDREQLAVNAVRSALFGAAFAIQGANMRAAANHEIQSSGAQITKYTQRRIWDLQPSGISTWKVQPMNIHDEILCVTHPDYLDKVETTVNEAVESFREKVPLIKMEWKKVMQTWASK